MKITKLVLLFNKDKIILGLIVSALLIFASIRVPLHFAVVFSVISGLILLNIALAILASYLLYDKSELYNPRGLFKDIQFKESDRAIFLHASFDPVSKELEKLIRPENLKVYNIYGNRHEDERSIEISNAVFPPHENGQTIDPTKLPDNPKSVNYIFAITSLHEILQQENRIKFFQEAKKVLEDDGTLIICEQMKNMTNFIFFNIGVFHFVSYNNWKQAIEKAGLRIV